MTQAIARKISLYDSDLNLWLETAIAQLKTGNLQDLDIENLIEELEGLAGRDRRELKNSLTTLIEHLLKRCYVKSEYDYAGWQTTIARTRIRIRDILRQSPSLKNYVNSPELFQQSFEDALFIVRSEVVYKSVDFPDSWEFNQDIESMLSVNFWK
ncbi:DUF29 domain-containing protein [Pseudanabaena mucicola]|uniref:DUF29 domain-containing protein n=1 Tax=Pseudanabaena mucicola FACHB-723 TaxID=2692860 RepID=A0ABR7ZU32_9CYAN|nr:DUF29 domain-containing protein [Pseudanabaena mucicola]MBD2186980.1 DUF29 domain-containing protein [Pseudanabaena mucicola FACHB-723]